MNKKLAMVLAGEGLRKEAASVPISVRVVNSGTWPDGTPWKEVELRGGGWSLEDDDERDYQSEFLSSVVGAGLF